jgi:5'-nucleotidase
MNINTTKLVTHTANALYHLHPDVSFLSASKKINSAVQLCQTAKTDVRLPLSGVCAKLSSGTSLRMNILVTNDDGISAQGLWTLVKALSQISRVTVVAPYREQSGVGTAVTLRQALRVRSAISPVPDVAAYSVEGTPADSVTLGLTKLADNKIDLVISGINHGANLGDNVLISGTVGAARHGHLHDLHSFAISVDSLDNPYLDTAAELAVLLAKRIDSILLSSKIFLNVNLPNLPLEQIGGLEITRLAIASHTDEVEEAYDGGLTYYRLIRQRTDRKVDNRTDLWALEQGYISITPLHANLTDSKELPVLDGLCSGLFQELRQS